MENFEIRTYGRTELALCYFPDLNPQVAYRKLQYWIAIILTSGRNWRRWAVA